MGTPAKTTPILTELEQLKLAEAFFIHSVSGSVILDRHYNFLRVNEAYARSAGRNVVEFAGRNHFEMYPSDAKPIFDEVVRSKRAFATFTRPFVFPDQPERGVTYWDWTLVPVLDDGGEVKYIVFSINDVTEQKRAEEALRESVARLEVKEAELREAKAALAAQVKQLRGMLPICGYCKNIRDDRNYWQQVENYLSQYTDVTITHSICPDCMEKLVSDISEGKK